MRQPSSNWLCAGIILCLMTVGLAPVPGEAADGEGTVRKTKERLHFQVPPDWPIEKRAGLVGPIPVEEYLAMKFKAIEAQLRRIEQHVNGLDLKVRVLEQTIQQLRSVLRSSEVTAP